jgi:hypothetical protein
MRTTAHEAERGAFTGIGREDDVPSCLYLVLLTPYLRRGRYYNP